MTPTTLAKAIVGVLLAVLGALGVVSPDDASNEEVVDTLVAGVGALILLLTPKLTTPPRE